jgi:hypothetical protein
MDDFFWILGFPSKSNQKNRFFFEFEPLNRTNTRHFVFIFYTEYLYYYFKACFWKFCSWKSERNHFPLQLIWREIAKKRESINKKHREAQRKQSLIENGKKIKELNELKRLHEIAYLFSRYY